MGLEQNAPTNESENTRMATLKDVVPLPDNLSEYRSRQRRARATRRPEPDHTALMKRDLTDDEWLAKIEWDALHVDFTGPKDRITTAGWRAWAGYEPNDYNGDRFKRGATDRFAHMTPAEQTRLGINWWERPEWR